MVEDLRCMGCFSSKGTGEPSYEYQEILNENLTIFGKKQQLGWGWIFPTGQ